MAYYKQHMKMAVRQAIDALKETVYTPVAELHAEAYVTKEPVPFAQKTTGTYLPNLKKGDTWGTLWDCAWFHLKGTVPNECKDKSVVLMLDICGEACVFDDTGCPVRGLTSVRSDFDPSLGTPAKRIYRFLEKANGGEAVDLWMDAGCNDLFGAYKGGHVEQLSIAVCNEKARTLYYDMLVLFELMEALDEKTPRHQRVLQKLYDAACVLGDFSDREIDAVNEILRPELEKKGGDPDLTISAIGHAHIDLAWLWPIRETIRKGARTFSTAVENMERYEDYRFGASQPQLYAWMKEYYPALYEKVKEKVKEGKFEPQGAMWVEADANISSGEALVRQILYGTKFYKDEFDFDVKNLWLPDVFGYNAALPQILKKSGIDYFMTQKLSWSEHNKFPHHTFMWKGIDGTEVLTHMLAEETYNGPATPKAIKKVERDFAQSDVSENALMLFGIGDGGGGPSPAHIERLNREKNLSGLIPVRQEWARDFFERIDHDTDRYPVWSGELYLEKHQGTLTTQARNKWYNRKMELSLRELEFALTLSGMPYDKEWLDNVWKEVLLYQFHDIIPGSSIDRVYDESLARYKVLYEQVNEKIKEAYEMVANKAGGDVLINALSWEVSRVVQTEDGLKLVTVPPMGYARVDEGEEISADEFELNADGQMIENTFLRVTFDEDGTISSIFDKTNEVEVLKAGTKGNRLSVYSDKGDCWDIPITYRDKAPEAFTLVEANAYLDGTSAVMEQKYTYHNSTLTQKIRLSATSARVDFETNVDWNESFKMLRTSFDVDVMAENASYEIQFGNIKRSTTDNTTWDMAKFEVCGNKWADLSDHNYGVALLNDCKYGYRIKGSEMDLNLLRSPKYPGKHADIAQHSFTYSIYPHAGDEAEGQVALEAYELNIPVHYAKASKTTETEACCGSFASVEGSAIIETVKPAEAGDGVIVRLYEHTGAPDRILVSFDKNYREIVQCDLMEREQEVLASDAAEVELSVGGFEIVTLKLKA